MPKGTAKNFKQKSEKVSSNNIRTWRDPLVREKRIKGIESKVYGSLSKEQFYQEKIKPLLYQGMTAQRIWSLKLIKLSNVSILSLIKKFGSTQDWEQVIKNREVAQVTSPNMRRGENHPCFGKTSPQKGKPGKLKGKTYEEILGPVGAKNRKQHTSDWMKVRNIRKYTTKISRPQRMLYEIIKEKYPTAVLEYEIKKEKGSYYLDIAIPELKINIEYDGIHWHKLNGQKKDEVRDKFLRDLGWRVFRFKFNNNPTKDQLTETIKQYNL